jgi:hypothetical protein
MALLLIAIQVLFIGYQGGSSSHLKKDDYNVQILNLKDEQLKESFNRQHLNLFYFIHLLC